MEFNRITYEELAFATQIAIEELTFEELVCIWLIVFKDQPHTFVAEMLDVSPQNISRWYRRGLDRFYRALEEVKSKDFP